MTDIPQDKIDAYLATDYAAQTGGGTFIMRIGTFSPDIQAIYERQGWSCCLFITAFNPFGREQNLAENELAQAELGRELRTLSLNVSEGEGADPTGEWDPEKSYLAFGIDEQLSRELGIKYRQDAVVWVGQDAVPQLLLLR